MGAPSRHSGAARGNREGQGRVSGSMPHPSVPRPRARVVTGIALAACGYALFSLQDAAVKWLVTSYAVPQILFVRSAVVVLIALGVGGGRRAVADVGRSRNKTAMVFRAAVILGAWLLFYTAAARMGLAELTTLYFAAPVIAVGLSALVLKEEVDGARWGAVMTDFVGVAVAAGPLSSMSAGPALMALGARPAGARRRFWCAGSAARIRP